MFKENPRSFSAVSQRIAKDCDISLQTAQEELRKAQEKVALGDKTSLNFADDDLTRTQVLPRSGVGISD